MVGTPGLLPDGWDDNGALVVSHLPRNLNVQATTAAGCVATDVWNTDGNTDGSTKVQTHSNTLVAVIHL